MADLQYALFTGCFIPARLPHVEAATLKVFDRLGVKVTPLIDASCCPDPTSTVFADKSAWYALAARNITLAEEQNKELLTICSGCNLTLSAVDKDLKRNQKLRDMVNSVLNSVGRRYRGTTEVRSILWLLYKKIGVEELRKQIIKPLNGLRVAPHLGCHIIHDLEEYDDPSDPISFNEIIRALGAEPIRYRTERLCCASFSRFIDESKMLAALDEKLTELGELGVDGLVTICPTCFLQYDAGQVEVNLKAKKNHNIPVFYYTQLLGLAMGFTVEEMGLAFHRIKADRLIQKLV
ncbi:MAG: CoB--CoM heterodisulfide reductase iron-sulfur subunit B family protein [Nitrososphaerales archaeon]